MLNFVVFRLPELLKLQPTGFMYSEEDTISTIKQILANQR